MFLQPEVTEPYRRKSEQSFYKIQKGFEDLWFGHLETHNWMASALKELKRKENNKIRIIYPDSKKQKWNNCGKKRVLKLTSQTRVILLVVEEIKPYFLITNAFVQQ